MRQGRRRCRRPSVPIPPGAADPSLQSPFRWPGAPLTTRRRAPGARGFARSPRPWGEERLAPAVLVAALLVATSAAFVVTEKLKLTRNPIVGPTVAKVFSPTCDCDTSSAEIRFRLRKADRVSVEITDSGGHVVRELARDRPQGRRFVTYVWDGRDANGRVVDEGTYKPRVHLARQRRTIVMPNRIRVDTTPPRVTTFTARPVVISPDGDGRFDRAKIRYRVDERATVELYVDGVRALRRLGTRTAGTMDSFGTAGGEPLPKVTRALRLVARDLAGNLGPHWVARRSYPLPRARARPRRREARGTVRDPRRLAGAHAPLEARSPGPASPARAPCTSGLRKRPAATCSGSTRTAT